MGVSGREMLDLLAAGETDAQVLARCARGRMKAKIPELERARAGTVGDHHRWLLGRQLAHSDYLDGAIAELSAQIARRLAPYEEVVALLDTIPGVGRQTAEALLAEIGTDMAQFPDAAHLANWAGMAPGNHESAGKRKGGKTRKGSRWLRAALVVAAQAAGRSKASPLGGRFRALAARRGKKRAAVAVGHSILILAYHILKDHVPYDPSRHAHRSPAPSPQPPRPPCPDDLVDQLRSLGFEVAIRPREEPAA